MWRSERCVKMSSRSRVLVTRGLLTWFSCSKREWPKTCVLRPRAGRVGIPVTGVTR